jgi:hypothetical protein
MHAGMFVCAVVVNDQMKFSTGRSLAVHEFEKEVDPMLRTAGRPQ